ncbi:hypothetical protein L210DRAFT_3580814 [Boletus edulis BED1]|uniref:RecQ-mediated genome instability protein 1 n=1 Tax=Boletus edulis BED1 TaxID=1328754 RepID=A0AAD4G5N2_BOLED|nr:hypothetical protein L210DRAFT_3580814 [Boletus edulis BED1]
MSGTGRRGSCDITVRNIAPWDALEFLEHARPSTRPLEWLADCSDWISSEFGLDPVKDFDQFIKYVELQLLQSNLADSTVPGSGIDPLLVTPNPNPARRPSNAARQAPRQKKQTGATPLLVEILSITEIAHSAFSILNTHQTRLDRADLGLAHGENAEQHRDEDEGPVPRFPRGMLRFELSDGLTTFRAIEFRPLPQLELDTTPLGYKMFLKSTPIRNGIAFLEPSNVILKGYRTEDHDINSQQVFLALLMKRLGRPDPPPEAPIAAQPRVNPPDSVPAQPARQHQPPPVARPPSPPTDLDDMYVDDDVDPDVLREMGIQMDEAIDMQENKRLGIAQPPVRPSTSKEKSVASSDPKQTLRVNTTIASPPLKASSSSSVRTSSYFTAHTPESKLIPDIDLSPRHILPPELEPDVDMDWIIDDPEPSKLPDKKLGSTSAKPPTASAKHVPPGKRPSSPDSYDELLFDMDMDESFLEQVGMIEQGALGTGADSKGKGKGKDTKTEGRPNVAPARKTPSGPALGTKPFVTCPVFPSRAEPSTRMPSNTRRATSASSLSDSTKSVIPRSTQSSDRRLPRDPSLIIISSSEDEVLGSRSLTKPLDLARSRATKGKEIAREEVADSEVIDISD